MLRWTTPAGDARQTHPARRRSRPHAVLRRPAPAGRHPGRVRHARASPAPTSTGARFTRLPHARHAGRRGRAPGPGRRAVRLRVLRGPRQGVPRVRPRRRTTTRSSRWIDHLVATLLDAAARRAPCWWSPPTTARSRSATTCSTLPGRRAQPTWRCSRARAGSAGCTPAPAAPTALLDAATELLGDHAWVRSRGRGDRGGLVRPDGHRRGRRPPGRRAAGGQGRPWPSTTPTDTGPYVPGRAATARSPRTRCSCRCWPASPG